MHEVNNCWNAQLEDDEKFIRRERDRHTEVMAWIADRNQEIDARQQHGHISLIMIDLDQIDPTADTSKSQN